MSKTATREKPWAYTTDSGNHYIINNGELQWICRCGNAADHVHTTFDMTREQYVALRLCGQCRQNHF